MGSIGSALLLGALEPLHGQDPEHQVRREGN